MNQIKELTREDWRTIRNGLDLLLRCKVGQLDEAFEVFYFEMIRRKEPKALVTFLRDMFRETVRKISERIWGNPNASYGIESLDDPIRQLIIQSDLRFCKYSDDLSKCPWYPNQCVSPTTGFCPKDPEKEK